MQEDIQPNRYRARVLTPRQSAPAGMVSTFDVDSAIQPLSPKSGRASTETEIPEELRIGLTDYRPALCNQEDLETDELYTEQSAQAEEGEVRFFSNQPQKGPFFARPIAQAEDGPECLPKDATSPPSSPHWIISAPDVERAIRRLYPKCGRAPTEVEIAEELRIDLTLYRETLSHLKDLEIGILYAERKADLGEEWMVYAPDGDGDVLFRCLRSEMQALFRDAICNLPRMERLVITLTYSEDLYDKSLSVILELPEPAISNIRTSAILHLRASLPHPELQIGPRVQGLLSAPNNGGTTGGNDESAKISANADVTVYGHQSGLLQKGRPWERLGDPASWSRKFRSWYSLNEDQTLTHIGRQEHYNLKLSL